MEILLKKEHFVIIPNTNYVHGVEIGNYVDNSDCPLARAIRGVVGSDVDISVGGVIDFEESAYVDIDRVSYATKEPWNELIAIEMYLNGFTPINLIKL